MKKIRILINPIAGSGLAPRIAKMVDASGLNNNYEVETQSTEYAGHAVELTREAVHQEYAAVIAVGGDGTVNEVASSLVGTNTCLGIIPAGSGNGLARHIGMNLNPHKGLMQLNTAKIEAIDSLKINDRFAVNVSGFGFDGYVAWLFNKSKKRGLSTYAKIGVQEYFRYPPADFKINIDGKDYEQSATMLVIANASQFGNAAVIAPRADLHDGLLDLVAVRRPGILHLPQMFFRLFNGTLKDNNYLKTYHCKKFTAIASRPLHLHIDGEAVDPISKIDVELFPASLKVLMPK